MRTIVAILSLLLAAVATAVEPDPERPPPPAATMPVEPALVRAADGPGPTFDANVVTLLDGSAAREINAMVLPAPVPATVPASFEVRAEVRMEPGGEGLGIVMLDAAAVDADPAKAAEGIVEWDEPSVRNAIGIGLDARNPPAGAGDASDGDGNVYDRPQREASVHVDGREILNAQSADFATGRPVPVVASVRFVPGGAILNLSVAGEPVYTDELLAGVRAFSPRVAIGARSGTGRAKLDVRALVVDRGPTLDAPFAEPRRFVLFDRTAVSLGTSREPITSVEFGQATRGVARAIATLKIAAPPDGMDRLDRRGALYCHAADGQRYELFRFRTAFAKEWQWSVDVTDFLPLMRDDSRFGLFIDTWQNGFLTSVTLDLYPGPSTRRPVAVTNLWQGEPILGEPTRPVSAFFNTRTVPVPPGVSEARVRITATGHGRSVNDDSPLNAAAEFLELWRELRVNGQTFENRLWKTDNYLNPCRPQRGKWATDRAGWGPGSIVRPWIVDVSPLLGTSVDRSLTIDYAIRGDYVNTHVGKGDPPTHWIDGQVIFYADPAATAPTTASSAAGASGDSDPARSSPRNAPALP